MRLHIVLKSIVLKCRNKVSFLAAACSGEIECECDAHNH